MDDVRLRMLRAAVDQEESENVEDTLMGWEKPLVGSHGVFERGKVQVQQHPPKTCAKHS